ncbi:MAG: hypothetical protein ABW170_23610 [Candidatus Thiodiazotropha sp. L084R]
MIQIGYWLGYFSKSELVRHDSISRTTVYKWLSRNEWEGNIG